MYELIEVPTDRILSRLLLKELVKDPRLAAAGRAVHDDEGRLLVTRHVHALCHVVPVHLLVVRGVELDRICTGRRLSLVLHVDDDELLPRFVGIGRRGGVRERRLRVEQARQLVLMPRHGHRRSERATVMEAQAFWARSLQRGRLRKLTFRQSWNARGLAMARCSVHGCQWPLRAADEARGGGSCTRMLLLVQHLPITPTIRPRQRELFLWRRCALCLQPRGRRRGRRHA